MRTALSILFAGIGSLIAAWVLPMLDDHLPRFVQIVLLIGGLALMAAGALLAIRKKRPDAGSTIDQRVTSHGQSGGITAHTINRVDD